MVTQSLLEMAEKCRKHLKGHLEGIERDPSKL